jgi:hypothetical protein
MSKLGRSIIDFAIWGFKSEEGGALSEKDHAVVGATGAQGGGLVRAILNDQAAAFRCGP